MPTLEELDTLLTYFDDRDEYSKCLYHRGKSVIKPKPTKCGPVIWIVKDGKPVDYTNRKE